MLAWLKIDDQVHSHPKARRAGLEAMGLWVLAGSHCMAYLTDGFIEQWFVESWPHGVVLAGKLVDVGLWDEAEGGWQFHDWSEYQPTRESVLADREAAAERKRRQRERDRGGDGRFGSRVTGTVTDGVSHGGVTPAPSPTPYPSVLKNTKRGTRVPDSFSITDEMREWAAEAVPLVDLDAKLGEWLDYWRSVPGQKGVKLDWVGTWRNGMRKQQEFAERDGKGKPAADPNAWMVRDEIPAWKRE